MFKIVIFVIFAFKSVAIVTSYSQVSKQPELISNEVKSTSVSTDDFSKPEDAFLGIYSDCVLYLSYTCLQKKTLMYLNKLEKQKEIPVLGNFLLFVKSENASLSNSSRDIDPESIGDHITPSPRLTQAIDDHIEKFFEDHLLRVKYGNNSVEDISVGNMLRIVEGRKNKNKGDGGGGGDGGKKKMMMMAMMCMKMKLMMMVPAMMGMMGMMSLKGVLLGGISLLISKVLLIMKLMGSGGGKGGSGGSPHGGSDPMWMAGGGGSGWNAGGAQDSYGPPGGGGGGGGSGYNSNGEWQSRSGREVIRIPIMAISRDVQSSAHNRRKRQILNPLEIRENDLDVVKSNFADKEVFDEHLGNVKDGPENVGKKVVARFKRWLYSSDDDSSADNKKTHKKRFHSKGKKKKVHAKRKGHKKIETMSEYMDGMKHAVEDNLWE